MDDNVDSELDETRSIEMPKDADLGSRKKFRSIERKKRRGFHGKKNWEMKREGAASVGDDTRPVAKNAIDSTPTRSQEKPMISARKLEHSPLHTIKGTSCQQQKLRRKGLVTSSVNKILAHGFKIQDASVLSKGLGNAAICAVCKKGKLLLLQNDKNSVGHIQKRIGTALRKLVRDNKGRKLADGKGVDGKGRLTKVQIDKMQNYYGMAIRKNSDNLKGMQNDIWAIYHHMIKANSSPLSEQHKYCPKGSGSWCKYWKDRFNGSKTYDDDTRLPTVFQPLLKGLFSRLTEKELLERCLKGLTQNQNESINAMLWKRCPKTNFCGKRRVRSGCC